jgi:3-oxoacyl-[acyl-carrier-protein] synthase-3
MTNEDFEKIIDTSDEWITKRTGIKRRHYVTDGMDNCDMCVNAAGEALKQAGLEPADLGGIVVATCTPEMAVPSTAGRVQRALDIPECFAFDVSAACTGFMYALKAASGLARPGGKPILVCGSETLSRFMNVDDRGSCILFADGAGAAIIEAGGNLKYFEIYSRPDADHTIEINGMNTLTDGKTVPWLDGSRISSRVALKGKEVYVYSTREVERVMNLAMEKLKLTVDDVDWFLMHQANVRIIKAAAERLHIPEEKYYVNIDDVANTSAASVPIALDQMNKKGLLKKGDTMVIAAFGGGLTSACAVYEWDL